MILKTAGFAVIVSCLFAGIAEAQFRIDAGEEERRARLLAEERRRQEELRGLRDGAREQFESNRSSPRAHLIYVEQLINDGDLSTARTVVMHLFEIEPSSRLARVLLRQLDDLEAISGRPPSHETTERHRKEIVKAMRDEGL